MTSGAEPRAGRPAAAMVLLWACACRTVGPLDRQLPAHYDPSPITRGGRVVLKCDPPDTEVALDGVPVGLCSDYASPARALSVDRGRHVLRLQKAGHLTQEREVAPDGAETVLQARMATIPPRSSTP